MTIKDDATLIIGTGSYYLGKVGEAVPTNLSAPGTGWDNIGHTSLEEILSLASEGGDKTVLGTLQNKNLRVAYGSRTESFSITVQQFDIDSLKLYFGSNATPIETGSKFIGVPNEPKPTEAAFLAVFVDGTNEFGIYIPKASIYRGDDMELSDTESLSGMPLTITALTHGTNAWNYAVTALGTVPTPTPPPAG